MKDKAENIITTELAKQNVTEAVIAKLKADYLPLKINGIDDKEGYKKVHDARIVCRDHRTLTEKICKLGREDAVKEQKAWIAKEKDVVAQISEVEQYLKKQEDAIDQIVEERKIRAERLLKLPGRKEQLGGLEDFLAEKYTDEIILTIDDIRWQQVIFTAQGIKLTKQQKEIDDAKAKERLSRLTERTNILYAVSVSMRSDNGRKEFIKGDVHYSEDEIADMSKEQWDKICSEFKSAVIPPKPEQTGYSVPFREGATPSQPKISEISDEEKLWNFGRLLEELVCPILKTEEGKKTLKEAERKIAEAIEILKK